MHRAGIGGGGDREHLYEGTQGSKKCTPMVLGGNPFGNPSEAHGVAGGANKKFTGEQMQMQGNFKNKCARKDGGNALL